MAWILYLAQFHSVSLRWSTSSCPTVYRSYYMLISSKSHNPSTFLREVMSTSMGICGKIRACCFCANISLNYFAKQKLFKELLYIQRLTE